MFVFSRGCQALGSNLSLASQIPLMSASCFTNLVRHYINDSLTPDDMPRHPARGHYSRMSRA